MLIKYCISNSATSDITEITDVAIENGNAIFTPIRESVLDIIIKDISGYEYERIVDMLFDHGKADISSFKDRTFLEEIDNNSPLGNKEETL